MKKHPVIIGICLLSAVGALFLLIMSVTVSPSGTRAFSWGNYVGVVTVEGVIRNSREIARQLEAYGRDDKVRAVVIRIDSPGGGVTSAQEIYQAVLSVKQKKKVVASMGTLAASGGYLVACAADRVVANPGTLTGSISTIMHFSNVEELLKKIGLSSSVIKSGRFKDIGSPTRGMTEEEKALLQSVIDDTYDQFLDAVAASRKMNKEDLRGLADGRIYTGRQAQKLGLVDELGDLAYSIRLAGTMAGIKGEPQVVYPAKKKIGVWELIFQQAAAALMAEWTRYEAHREGLYYLYER